MEEKNKSDYENIDQSVENYSIKHPNVSPVIPATLGAGYKAIRNQMNQSEAINRPISEGIGNAVSGFSEKYPKVPAIVPATAGLVAETAQELVPKSATDLAALLVVIKAFKYAPKLLGSILGDVGKADISTIAGKLLDKYGLRKAPDVMKQVEAALKGSFEGGAKVEPKFEPGKTPYTGSPIEKVIESKTPQTTPIKPTEAPKGDIVAPLPIFGKPPEGQTESKFVKGILRSDRPEEIKAGVAEDPGRFFTPRNTEELGNWAKERVKANPEQAKMEALQGTDEKSVALANALADDYVARGDVGSARQLITDRIAKATEAGRNVQAYSLFQKLDAPGIVMMVEKRIARMMKDNPGLKSKITDKQIQDFVNRAKYIDGLENPAQKVKESAKLINDIHGIIPDKFMKKAIQVWKAGILTGLKTSGVNLSSNATMMFSEYLSRFPATVVDKIASLFTGKRSVSVWNPIEGTKGMGEGTVKGAKSLWTGIDERMGHNIFDQPFNVKVQFSRTPLGQSLQKSSEFVFNVLGAEDRPTYYAALRMAEREQLRLGVPVDVAERNATKSALQAVFQDDTVLGNFLRGVQKANPNMQFLIPFARTPAALATRFLEYSPMGVVKAVAQNIGKGKFNQRDFSTIMGRSVTGTGLFYIGKELYKNGFMSGERPREERLREQQKLTGTKPNSIKVGDSWWGIGLWGVQGMSLQLGALYQKYLDEEGKKTRGSQRVALARAMIDTGRTFVEQTPLTGMSTALNSLSDPQRYGNAFVTNTGSSVIPTIVGDVSRAMDPLERQTLQKIDSEDLVQSLDATKKGVMKSLTAKIPGVRESLPPRTNVFGEPLKRPTGVLNTMINPARPSRIINADDPTIQELERLSKDKSTNATPVPIKPRQEIAGVKFFIPSDDLYDLTNKAGKKMRPLFDRVVKYEAYKTLSDNEKAAWLRKIATDIQSDVVAKYAVERRIINERQTGYLQFQKIRSGIGRAGNFFANTYSEWSAYPKPSIPKEYKKDVNQK